MDIAPAAPGAETAVGTPPNATTVESPAVTVAAAQVTQRAAPTPAPARPPEPALAPKAAAQAVPVGAAPAGRRQAGLWLGLVGMFGCVVLLAGAYFLAGQMGVLPGTQLSAGAPTGAVALAPQATAPEAAAIQPVATELAAPEAGLATALPNPPPTLLPPAASLPTSVPAASLPTQTAALAPTAEVIASLTPEAPPAASAPPAALAEPVVLFEDTFDNGLAGYWRTWGSPRPLIDRGPGDSWLSLKALEVPTSGGLTSRPDFVIFNEPGTAIEFEAQLDSNYPMGILLLDWDPEGQFDRGPDNGDPGLIHLEVRKDQVVVQTGLSGEKCSQEVTGLVKHTYTLRIENDQAVNLYIDGQPASQCNITDMGLEPMAGSISFSGLGWVTRVKVSQP